LVPCKVSMNLAKIVKPYYDRGGRKYMMLEIDEVIYDVKVPFRYNRVMCHIEGIRPIQDYNMSEFILVTLDRRIWNGEHHYVLLSIRSPV